MNWGHDQLANDLADHLRSSGDREVWTNMQLGPSGSCRPDVYCIAKSYAHFQVDAYECKVTASDLRHDLTEGKWQKYREYAHRVWFAVPQGLSHADVPRECGVIVRHDKVWRSARRPVAIPLDTLPHDAWMKLVIDGLSRARRNAVPEPRSASDWHLSRTLRKKFGDQVADLMDARRYASDRFATRTKELEAAGETARQAAEEIVRNAREQARRQTERLDVAQAALAEAVGLPRDVAINELVAAVHNLAHAFDSNFNIESVIRALKALQSMKVRTEIAIPDAQMERAA